MAEKMTLTKYLAQRGVKAKALTRGEAALLGIPFPLQGGWARKHGAMVIEEEILPQLAAYAETARQAAERKTKAGSVAPCAAAPAAQLPLAIPPRPTRVSPVLGFVLRRPKRYCARKPAPWA